MAPSVVAKINCIYFETLVSGAIQIKEKKKKKLVRFECSSLSVVQVVQEESPFI